MASLTKSMSESSGNSLLYVPSGDEFDLNGTSNSTIKDLESIVMFWTRQIYELTKKNRSNKGDTFMEELTFWKLRVDALSKIILQLENIQVKQILQYLTDTHSTHLKSFYETSAALKVSREQACNNVSFLSILDEPCKSLAQSDLSNISSHYLSLLNGVRLIHKHSSFYNTRNHISNLLRGISNEVVSFFRSKIDVSIYCDSMDMDKNTLKVLQDYIKHASMWKSAYHEVTSVVNKESSSETNLWDFDEKLIFGQLNMFIQRCNNLFDICLGKLQFMFNDSDGVLVFGGANGNQTESSFREIKKSFQEKIKYLSDIQYDVLDTSLIHWYNDYNTYKSLVKVSILYIYLLHL